MDLRSKRKEIGLTQEQLAAKMGVGRTTITGWEQKTSYPHFKQLPKLAAVLHCDISDLFKRKV